MFSGTKSRAWIRYPIGFNPFDSSTRRFLIPPPPQRSSSSPFFSVAMVAATTAAASAQSPAESSNTRRPVCPSCSKPVRTCLCGRIHSLGLDNSVGVTVLQHSLEEKHPLNSVRIVKLGFRNVAVAAVSDVNFDARFSIWLPEESEEDCRRELGIDIARNQELGFLDDVGKSESKSFAEDLNLVENRGGGYVRRCEDGGLVARDSELPRNRREPVIEIFMGKKGLISSIEQTLKLDTHPKRPSFDDILSSELAHGVLSRGFGVRKLQKRQVSRSLELEEYEEFELEVPSGSVLLFPSEEALSVDELKASGFAVKNLIVLDGTWLKARRMYCENPWLRFLPHLKLDPQVTSLYAEVRSQPRAGCLSTLESIVYTLKELGDECSGGLDNLLEVFGSMVDDQRRCKDERLNQTSGVEGKEGFYNRGRYQPIQRDEK